MKGYLSRIAKQSGFQFAAARPASAGGTLNLEPLAPELEQTRMVEGDSIEVSEARLALSPERVPAVEVRREVAGGDDRASQAKGPLETRENPASRVIPATRGPDNAPRGVSRVASEPGVSRGIEPAAPPRVIDALVFQYPAPVATRARPDAELTAPAPKVAVQVAPPDIEPQEYFARTAEILSDKDTVTADLQSIVLREVQEWVAAAPAERPATQIEPPQREATRLVKSAQPRAPEVGPIRESEVVAVPELARLVEQNYDLSIGSINITIEEAEQPQAPDPRTRRPRDAASTNERSFSRLSRSYL